MNTKGPWKVNEYREIEGENGLLIARAYNQGGITYNSEETKNLILAAPDMYESLKEYIEHVDRFHGENRYSGNRCEWCQSREKEMRQALSKAEGRQL